MSWTFYLSSTFCRNAPNIEMDKKTFLVNCDRAVEYLNSLERSSERCFWHLTSFILLQLSLLYSVKNYLPVNAFFHVLMCNYHFFLSISVFYTLWFLLVQFHNFHTAWICTYHQVFVNDQFLNWDPENCIKVCIILAWAYHLLFMHNMWVKFKLKLPLLKTLLQNCFGITSLA